MHSFCNGKIIEYIKLYGLITCSKQNQLWGQFKWLQLSSLIWSISKDIPVDLSNLFWCLTILTMGFFLVSNQKFPWYRFVHGFLCFPYASQKKFQLCQSSQSHQLPDLSLFFFVNLKEHKGYVMLLLVCTKVCPCLITTYTMTLLTTETVGLNLYYWFSFSASVVLDGTLYL